MGWREPEERREAMAGRWPGVGRPLVSLPLASGSSVHGAHGCRFSSSNRGTPSMNRETSGEATVGELTGEGAAACKDEQLLLFSCWTYRRIPVTLDRGQPHGGCPMSGPKVAKFLDR